jgi:hypothetical protein
MEGGRSDGIGMMHAPLYSPMVLWRVEQDESDGLGCVLCEVDEVDDAMMR